MKKRSRNTTTTTITCEAGAGAGAGCEPDEVPVRTPARKRVKTKPKSKSKSKSKTKPKAKPKRAPAPPPVTFAEIDCIFDEREGKDGETEYCVAWMDGEDPQWLAAADVEGTAALEDWLEKEEEGKEEPEDDATVEAKAQQLAGWIKAAKRPVFLCGAGLSASAGLATFRGRAGLWTKGAAKASTKVPSAVKPTEAHLALTALEKAGHVYWVATQNYDGLASRSGFPEEKLSELHGNIFKEVCESCGHSYLRDFEVEDPDCGMTHLTGRVCDQAGCSGRLRDNIVHFDEALPWKAITMANAKSKGADLAIVLGSSLRVEPAASLPFKCQRRRFDKGKTVIVNLGRTPRDDAADLVIRGTCDAVMTRVATLLLGKWRD